MTEELKKEILNILDNVYYWETCPQEYNDRIDAVKKQLTLTDVGCSLISEEEFNLMANDYIKLECHEYDGFDIKAKRFKDYRNGLKNMHETMKLLN